MDNLLRQNSISTTRENQLDEVTDQKERFLTLVWGLFITFMLSGVHLAKSLSAEEAMFVTVDKHSFSSEVEIRETTCLGTQTSITVILKRVHITCRLEKKKPLHPF